MFLVDAHLDLAYNALNFGRDLLKPVDDVRRAEIGLDQSSGHARGTATVTIPELRRAGVGLVFATLFATPAGHRLANPGDLQQYRDYKEAHRLGQVQLDYYHRLAGEVESVRLVGNRQQLDEVTDSHRLGEEPLLGIIPLMEGADFIREPAEVELWYEGGLRIIGLAWDDTRYAPGSWRAGGGLTIEGRRLLGLMADFGLILDLSHMSEEASLQALDRYEGPVIASHSNARVLVPGQRQLSDDQIRLISERDGVIGVVLYNGFLKTGYRRGDARELVGIDDVVAHIDHICQCIGDAAHVGIGSDFDGGFGLEDIPMGLNGPADLALIGKALLERGFEEADIEAILGGNWLSLMRRAW